MKTPPYRRGLVVGKFAPLHRGHQFLIDTARGQCEELVIISYAKPELPGCSPERREQWLEALYPRETRLVVTDAMLHHAGIMTTGYDTIPHDADPETQHRRFVGMLCRHLLGVTVDAVFTSEDYGDGFAAELTTFFRERDPQAPPVRHLQVDRARRQLPISGTLIRQAIHDNRHWLAPVVYASFVTKVCILGGESSGKSTLAAALANRFGTLQVPEYGRELWEAKEGKLEFRDMRHIARKQVALEEEASRNAVRFLFCDTSPLTTAYYTNFLFGRRDPVVEELSLRSYDLTVLCEPDIPFHQDGTRQDSLFREQQHRWYREVLHRRNIPFVSASGDVETRVERVAAALAIPETTTARRGDGPCIS
jgi:NadR type nicotinamide-nucleotide adenylyltransferase